MINYKNSAFEKLDGRIEYLLNPKKTNQKWQKGNFVDPEDAMHGFQVIHDRHQPKGTRFFRQGILCFGEKNISHETAFKVGCEVFHDAYKEYPYLLCVHTNLPRHVHVHFLQFTVNINDGSKWGQSFAEFAEFRDYVDHVLEKNRLPLLKRKKSADEADTSGAFMEEVNAYGEVYPVQITNPILNVLTRPPRYPYGNPNKVNYHSQIDCRIDLARLPNRLNRRILESMSKVQAGP
jgi:hypothetical protein